jgi:hypothetical protein
MIQPGMMFGGEGPVMQGTWYNPRTGDAFTVRDSFFEDNQYVITTTDGRYLRYDQIQNYIQSDMKLEDLKQLKTENKLKEDPIPAEVSNLIDTGDDLYFADMIIPEDANILSKSIKSTSQPININSTPSSPVQTSVAQVPPVNMNTVIIEKALRNTEQPTIKINIDWSKFPSKEIEMLYDIMGISEEEIIDWYLDNIEMVDLIEALQLSIKNYIISNPVEASIDTVVKVDNPAEVITEPTTTPKKLEEPKTIKAAKQAKEKKTKMTKK